MEHQRKHNINIVAAMGMMMLWGMMLAACAMAGLSSAADVSATFVCNSDADCVKQFGLDHWCNVTSCGYPGLPICTCTSVRPPCANLPISVLYSVEGGLCAEICGAPSDDDADCDTSRCVAQLGDRSDNPTRGACGADMPTTWNCTDLAYLGQPCALKCAHCYDDNLGYCCGGI